MAEAVEAKLAELGVRDPQNEDADGVSDRDDHSASQGDNSSASVPKDTKLIVKFLMSNAAAGAIIGKGGASIAELQDNSGARLQLSRAAEFFPGTSDRVMLIAGTLNAILAALHLVLTKVQSEQVSKLACCRVTPAGWPVRLCSGCKSLLPVGRAWSCLCAPVAPETVCLQGLRW